MGKHPLFGHPGFITRAGHQGDTNQ